MRWNDSREAERSETISANIGAFLLNRASRDRSDRVNDKIFSREYDSDSASDSFFANEAGRLREHSDQTRLIGRIAKRVRQSKLAPLLARDSGTALLRNVSAHQ